MFGGKRVLGRTTLVLVTAFAAAALTVVGVIVVEQRSTDSRVAQVDLANAKATLNKLQWIPYEAVADPAGFRRQMTQLEGEVTATIDRLAAGSGEARFAATRRSLRANLDALEGIYSWSVGGADMSKLVPHALKQLLTLNAVDADLDAVGGRYASNAQAAQLEATSAP